MHEVFAKTTNLLSGEVNLNLKNFIYYLITIRAKHYLTYVSFFVNNLNIQDLMNRLDKLKLIRDWLINSRYPSKVHKQKVSNHSKTQILAKE